MNYDAIIVGAGSAGCVLAARLSEDPDTEVLLLEAGPDYPDPAEVPSAILSSHVLPDDHDWGTASEPGYAGHPTALLRGKVVGGSSAVNAAVAARGLPSDYDGWAAAGNPGWSFEEVLPFFRALEDDPEGDERWHGRGGPLPIRRYAPDELTPWQRNFVATAVAESYPEVGDFNGPEPFGVGRYPMNVVDGVRQNAALSYLTPEVRERENLTVRADVLVDRVVFSKGRAIGVGAVGVEAPPYGIEATLGADRVILAAGAYGSPAILMRSGVGPADHLRSLGVEVVQDLPGVGQGLQDHPLFHVLLAANPEKLGEQTPPVQTLLWTRSRDETGDPDLHLVPQTAFADPALSPTGAAVLLSVGLVRPLSRGRLELASADPKDAPRADPNYLGHPEDRTRMVQGVRLARRLARTAPLSNLVAGELFPGESTPDDAALEEAVRAGVSGYQHATGTARMGPEGDEGAVVDARGAVHGVEGLSVIDASIMPTVPHVATNLSTMMLAERCAAWLVRDLAGRVPTPRR